MIVQKATKILQGRRDFVTRILLEIVVGTAMAFFVMYLWYITQPITIVVIEQTKQLAQDMGQYNTFISQGITILTYIEYFWGPLLVIATGIVWVFAAAHRKDWESRLE